MKHRIAWPALLLIVFALSRWPGAMPQNFSAAYAMVFCAGLFIQGRLGWILPLATLAVSDAVITALVYRTGDFSWRQFLADQAPNYIAYAGILGLGRLMGRQRPWWMLLGGGMLGAILFYLVTNTAAWLTLPYARTFSGWIQALTSGFPGYPQTWEFFRNTLLSGGLFTGLFVGAMRLTEASESAVEKREPEEAEAEPVSNNGTGSGKVVPQN